MTSYNETAVYKIEKIKQVDVEQFELIIATAKETETILVTSQVLVELELLKPQAISKELYDTLIKSNQRSQGYVRALNFISFRKRSIGETKQYLRDKLEIEASVSDEIIAKLKQQNYLNDEAFIKAFVNDSFITSTKGPKKIIFEVTSKYFCPPELATAVVGTLYTEEKQVMQLEKLQKKLLRKKYLSVTQAKEKIKEKEYDAGFYSEVMNAALATIQPEMVLLDERKIEATLQKIYRKQKAKAASSYELKQQLMQSLVRKQVSYEEANAIIEDFLEKSEK